MENCDKKTDLEAFLTKHSLQDFLPRFIDQQIDYDVLTILTEADLKSLCLPVGPFRRLMVAIASLKKNGDSMDTHEAPPAPVISGKTLSETNSISDIINQIPDITDIASGSNDTFHVIDESGDEDDPTSKPHLPDTEIDKLHPYLYDLQNFKHDFSTWDFKPSDLVEFDKKQFQLVETVEGLRDMARILRRERVIGVDFYNNEAKYKAYVSFMAISTMTHDFVVDFMTMKSETTVLELQDILINPEIVKVFYESWLRCKHLNGHYQTYALNVVGLRCNFGDSNLKKSTSIGMGRNIAQLVEKYDTYQKPSLAERPFTSDIIKNLRKQSHYILHEFLSRVDTILVDKTQQDEIIQQNKKIASLYQEPFSTRPVHLLFDDFNKFNEFQKSAAHKIYEWRESVAQKTDTHIAAILNAKSFRNICLCLPVTKDDLATLCTQKHVLSSASKILDICRQQRNIYDKTPRDPQKYALFDLPASAKRRSEAENAIKRLNKRSAGPPVVTPPKNKIMAPNQRKSFGYSTNPHSESAKSVYAQFKADLAGQNNPQRRQNNSPRQQSSFGQIGTQNLSPPAWNMPMSGFINYVPGYGANRSGQTRDQNQGQNRDQNQGQNRSQNQQGHNFSRNSDFNNKNTSGYKYYD